MYATSFLLASCLVAAAAAARCPPGYILAYAGQCMRVAALDMHGKFGTAYDWANEECAKDGAYLPFMKSYDDVTFFDRYRLATAKNPRAGNILLGAYCNQYSQRMQWLDDTKMNFTYPNFANDKACSSYDLLLYAFPANGANNWVLSSKGTVGDVDIYCMKLFDADKDGFNDPCEEYYEVVTSGEQKISCIKMSSEKREWNSASSACKSNSSELISIHNKETNSYIRRLAVSHGLIDGIYIGGQINGEDVQWTDGTPMDYTNFDPGFPIPGFGDCLAMDTNMVTGQWINMACQGELPFACARNYELPSCGAKAYKEGEMIFAPDFPYPVEPCDYILVVDAGKRVQVEIVLLEANSYFDFLVLSEGPLGGAEIAK